MSLPDDIKKEIEEVSAIICDKLCRFRSTCDDDFKCDYQRENNMCPLDRLQG